MAEDIYRDLYNHYWEHARHQEWQRLTFVGSYTVAIGAVLAFLEKQNLKELDPRLGAIIMAFLAGLSVYGFLMMHTWAVPFVRFSRLTELIARARWNVPAMFLRFTPHTHDRKISARDLFAIYFGVLGSAFISASIIWISSLRLTLGDIILTFFPPLTAFLMVYFCKFRREISRIELYYRQLINPEVGLLAREGWNNDPPFLEREVLENWDV